jgi:hypothetical protein
MGIETCEYSDIINEDGVSCAWPVLQKDERSFRRRHARWNRQELFLADDVVRSDGSLDPPPMHFGARGVLVKQPLEFCVRIMIMPEVVWRRDRSWRPCLGWGQREMSL